MPTFFHSWRRKIGVLTLGIASVLMVGWVRSYHLDDILHFQRNGSETYVASFTGMISLKWSTFHPSAQLAFPPVRWSSIPVDKLPECQPNNDGTPRKYDPWTGHEVKWRWDWAGFHFGVGTAWWIVGLTNQYMVPYWTVVIPLILLSAYLLLSKPRVAKPKSRPTHV